MFNIDIDIGIDVNINIVTNIDIDIAPIIPTVNKPEGVEFIAAAVR